MDPLEHGYGPLSPGPRYGPQEAVTEQENGEGPKKRSFWPIWGPGPRGRFDNES